MSESFISAKRNKVGWYMPIIPALKRLRQEDYCIVKPSIEEKERERKRRKGRVTE